MYKFTWESGFTIAATTSPQTVQNCPDRYGADVVFPAFTEKHFR
jgi:hypothetical protein